MYSVSQALVCTVSVRHWYVQCQSGRGTYSVKGSLQIQSLKQVTNTNRKYIWSNKLVIGTSI